MRRITEIRAVEFRVREVCEDEVSPGKARAFEVCAFEVRAS
jgi:hypothetical protein